MKTNNNENITVSNTSDIILTEEEIQKIHEKFKNLKRDFFWKDIKYNYNNIFSFNNKADKSLEQLNQLLNKASTKLKTSPNNIYITISDYSDEICFNKREVETDTEYQQRKQKLIKAEILKQNKNKIFKLKQQSIDKKKKKETLLKLINDSDIDIYEIFQDIQKQKINK